MLSSDAQQYHAFAGECLEMADKANDEDVRRRLIELSHEWMAAALMEERAAQRIVVPLDRAADYLRDLTRRLLPRRLRLRGLR
jgi:hypothetical protein